MFLITTNFSNSISTSPHHLQLLTAINLGGQSEFMMDRVLLLDDITSNHNKYGADLRLFDSVLAATGFDSINFTPINIDRTTSSPKRRKIAYKKHPDLGTHRFECDTCQQTFPLKKTRDRHKESVHNKQQTFPCRQCSRIFNRKDIRSRHLAEKHSGQRRSRKVSSNAVSEPDVGNRSQEDFRNPQSRYEEVSLNQPLIRTISYSMDREIYSATDIDDYIFEDDSDITEEDRRQAHDCLGLVGFVDLTPVGNPLLLCVNLLIRCKPYRRFYIHDKRRDLVARNRPKSPNSRFWELYGLAIRTLSTRLASGTKDAELLAAVVAFANVDVLISGSERMGNHAQAMYAMKAHHRSRRDPIFEALQLAFEHCGKTCRSIRIIYTKSGFVWMLNVRQRVLDRFLMDKTNRCIRWDTDA